MESYQTWRGQAVDELAHLCGRFRQVQALLRGLYAREQGYCHSKQRHPYSWPWLDLRAEPWVVSVPEVPKDRYYVMQWIDLFTQNFGYVGVRATGNKAGSYLIAGPQWNGGTPEGITAVLKSETDIVGTLTRTSLAGPEDVANVKAIQAKYKLQPLHQFLGTKAPKPAAPISSPSIARRRRSRGISSPISTSFFSSPSLPSRKRPLCARASGASVSSRENRGTRRNLMPSSLPPSTPAWPTGKRRSRKSWQPPTVRTDSSAQGPSSARII
ncbi:DUF1254 domain-containing protein [Novosphingobium panipatense]|uniref:DUF1254 domain-containing protein n=1 Tax=Novosphingobium panipatense TaxID=428991 RepID=UPI003624192B